MSDSRNKACDLLKHYLEIANGGFSNDDCYLEIESIVDYIIDAAEERILKKLTNKD